MQALTVLTLAAGFASTIFAPLTVALETRLSWRGVYLTLAAAPLTAAGAVAPSVGAGIAAATGSFPALFIVLAATAAAGAALAVTVPSPAGPHNPGAGSGDSDQARREPPNPLG